VHFKDASIIKYRRGEIFPDELYNWRGDWLISFKSDLLLPKKIIANARLGSINFHASLPKYRGIGGYLLALKNKDKFFGVTCHYTDEFIDHGPIIKTKKFKIDGFDTPKSLYHKAGLYCNLLLLDILTIIKNGQHLPIANKKWGKRLFLYHEFHDEINEIVD
jgi:methionyl-tRNA formyltransferase